MSVVVIRRTHEIGIRLAIGATLHGVLGALFARAVLQFGIGFVLATHSPSLITAIVASVS